MIGPAPEYTKSRYFISEPKWRLADGAPDKLKYEFEKDMNTKELTAVYKKSYPKMENPFYTWQGEIIDKK